MLTKNLVRFKNAGGEVIPEFVAPSDPLLLGIAEELLGVFNNANGKTRQELLDESNLVIEGAPASTIILRGLEKLLLDRTEFDTAPNEELIQFRKDVFRQTNEWLVKESFADYQAYYERVTQTFSKSAGDPGETLYSDLPEYQRVDKFKSFTAERLLHRYNCAQVQGLLIHSGKLTLKISDSHPESLRQLFKYLRFHQLLAMIRKEAEDSYLITVDGPLNLFYKTQKYGLNLALFFPAVLHQQQWAMEAEIQLTNQRSSRLTLDQSSGLQPYSHRFLAYVPEEIAMFQVTFSKKTGEWQIAPGGNFVPLVGEFYCFPDFELTHHSNQRIALELFHPWHASHLTQRLQQLEKLENPPLIIGVSKALLNDPLAAQTVENSAYFSAYGFIFREMPTMDKLLPILTRVLEEGK